MNGHTHILGGLAAGAIAAPALALGHAPAFLIAATLAGPLADIDHPGSMYGRWLPVPGVMQVGAHIEPYRGGMFGNAHVSHGRVGRRTPFGIAWHRGPTHSLFTAEMFTALAFLVTGAVAGHSGPLPEAIALGVLVGYLSHLLLDSFNIMGQQILWPFSHRQVKFGAIHFPVGGIGETVTVVLLVGVLFLIGPHLLSGLVGGHLFSGGATWIP